jgi:cell division protein FtsQ
MQNAEPGGLWHQPALMNLLADLLIVAAVAALSWAALTALQRLPLFPLRQVVLTGVPAKVSAAQVEHAARSAVVGNFFTVDLEAARAAFEKQPGVRKATRRRQWPDGLALTLEEHEALARWRRPGHGADDDALVNTHGEVFVAELPDAGTLPRFSGPDGSAPELLQRHAEFAAALAAIGRRVETVTLSPRRAWRLRLDDGVALDLGRDEEQHPLAERLGRFIAHYDTVKAKLGAARVADMRYPNGFAVSGYAVGGTRSATPQERKS